MRVRRYKDQDMEETSLYLFVDLLIYKIYLIKLNEHSKKKVW